MKAALIISLITVCGCLRALSDLPDEDRDRSGTIRVEPSIGPDSYTIELDLVPELEGFENYNSDESKKAEKLTIIPVACLSIAIATRVRSSCSAIPRARSRIRTATNTPIITSDVAIIIK